MSRIGKLPIPIPAGVTVETSGASIRVKGPKGTLERQCPNGVRVTRTDGGLLVERASDTREHRERHGLARQLVANMVQGVSTGFSRVLEINGVGYRAEVKGNALQLSLGYSHQVMFPLPPGVTARVERSTIVTLEAIDRQLLGQTAAAIRKIRPVEPYKGKGVRYGNEVVRRKAGKAAGAH